MELGAFSISLAVKDIKASKVRRVLVPDSLLSRACLARTPTTFRRHSTLQARLQHLVRAATGEDGFLQRDRHLSPRRCPAQMLIDRCRVLPI